MAKVLWQYFGSEAFGVVNDDNLTILAPADLLVPDIHHLVRLGRERGRLCHLPDERRVEQLLTSASGVEHAVLGKCGVLVARSAISDERQRPVPEILSARPLPN